MMKKLFALMLAMSGLFAAASAEAQWNRPRPSLQTIVGQGVGGTTHGDRDAACSRAYSRAQDDAYRTCSSRRGYVYNSDYGDCNCSRKPGSKDDYNCRASVYVTCEIR